MKWLFLVLTLTAPSLAATLHGTVLNEENRPVSGAKVILFHDLASILIQRGISDRNGFYQFEIGPGPYRVFVIKKGYRTLRAQIMALKEKERIDRTHILLRPMDERQNPQKNDLKSILLDSQRKPYRFLHGDLLPEPQFSPVQPPSFSGVFRTAARHDLQGNLKNRSALDVQTKLADRIQMQTGFIKDGHENSRQGALRVRAGLSLHLAPAQLEAEAESIQGQGETRPNHSSRFAFSADYGNRVKLSTATSIKQSTSSEWDQEERTLTQQVAYQLFEMPIQHRASFREWRTHLEALARQVSLQTQWAARPRGAWGLSSRIDRLEIDETKYTRFKLFATQAHEGNHLALHSRVGVLHEDGQNALLQHYQVNIDLGLAQLTSAYEQDAFLAAYAVYDLFGSYLELSMPYRNESFFERETANAMLRLKFASGFSLHSELYWEHYREQAALLFARNLNDFKPEASLNTHRYGYAVESKRLGASLEWVYSHNRSQELGFNQHQLSYLQTLSPAQAKGLHFYVEFQVKRQPTLPAWWLFQMLPWNPNETLTHYEGQVKMQF